MTKQQWSRNIPSTEAYARAGGRRRWNEVRQLHALLRRLRVAKYAALGYSQTAIAAELQVHKSTVCRDLARLAEELRLRPSYFLP
jgi:DNA-binding NarL/FixJ family response regulator